MLVARIAPRPDGPCTRSSRATSLGRSLRPDPRPGSAGSATAVAGPVPLAEAVLLAPCRPRVVLGMAHNTGPADRLLPAAGLPQAPRIGDRPRPAPIRCPTGIGHVDAEAELAVVIGDDRRNLTPGRAGRRARLHVRQRRHRPGRSRTGQPLDRGQEAGRVHPARPVDPDRPRPGGRRRSASDDNGPARRPAPRGLARNVIEVLVYLTSIMTLHPGDVVLTGAPGEPARRIRPGGHGRDHRLGAGLGDARQPRRRRRRRRCLAAWRPDDQRPSRTEVVTFGEAMAMFVAGTRAPWTRSSTTPGRWPGAETNVATGLARLGHSAGWIGRVGDDPFGRFIHHRAVRAPASTPPHVSVDRDAPTGFQLKAARRRRRPGGRLLPEELGRLPAGAWDPATGGLHRRRPAPARHRDPARPVGQHPGLRVPGRARGPRRGVTVSFDTNLRPVLWASARRR